MRHGVKLNHLGRTASHRKAMLSNMASSLIKHKKIVTTVAKAKALRVYVEPILTKAKSDSVHNRRTIFSYLRDKEAIKELFASVSPKIMDRPGGYTRVLKIGTRMGDNAEMAMIELVDFNEFIPAKAAKSKKKTTRRGRSGKAGADNAPIAKEETVAEETTEVVDTVEEVVNTAETTEVESTETKNSTEQPESSEENEEKKKED